tara:strand:- start:145 stop:381 length:237 start_codon:yes stop_codon:yes gene_type:complete
MEYQKFRFCLRCQRVSLIKKDGCFVCNGTFILDTVKPDSYMANIQKYNKEKKIKEKQKLKQKQNENELLQHQKIDQRI